jgi:hypothetical protein
MRMLLWHCAAIAYVDGRPSNRPPGVHTELPGKSRARFSDIVVAFATIEESDTRAYLEAGADAIAKLVEDDVATGGALVMPFAHLSKDLATGNLARGMLRELTTLVADRGCLVQEATFGFHKYLDLSFSAYAHPGSVAFREFR